MDNYIFTSERLGFRNWKASDTEKLYIINSDDEVMKYFPKKNSIAETEKFIERMQAMLFNEEYCYFAVETLKTATFIGFIGLSKQTYKADFNPSIDIGWRIHPDFWYKGFATEGAKACLHYAFHQLNIKRIISVAPIINVPSIAVMQKIGMRKVKEFKHPLLKAYQNLENCVLFEIES